MRSHGVLSDAQWEKIYPYLPQLSSRGRPWADDRACLEGILWVLRTGARWRDVPEPFPSGSTCWRRLKLWSEQEVWLHMWRAFLRELDNGQLLDWEECFVDGTFASAKKGAMRSEKPSGARAQSLWWWQTARVYLWEFRSTQPAPLR